MGNEFGYVNLDAREQGIRYVARIYEDKLDPQGKLLPRLYDPNVIRKLPFWDDLLPRCSLDQRRHLGQLDIAPELWSSIVAHLTDLTSTACFGAAHPLLTHCALQRMVVIQMSLEAIGTWAGHRIALINNTFCPALPKEVYPTAEWVEWDPEQNGCGEFFGWADADGYEEHPIHGDEWVQRGGVWQSLNSDPKATARWESRDWKKHNFRVRSDKARKADIDYTRVWTYLDYIENTELWQFDATEDSQFVLCNETKHEYVLAADAAWFNRPCEYRGPEIFASWTLGDTAGFLVCWDVDGHCGRGEGPWAGDRIRVTTFEHMEAMEGSPVWKDVGAKDAPLWENIRAFLKKFFTYGGRTWQQNYDRAGYIQL